MAATATDKVGEEEAEDEIASWKAVHTELTRAVLVAQEAVTAKKLQKRYLLEEIAANLTEEGTLTPMSVWKKPSKKKVTSSVKSKRAAKATKAQKAATDHKKRISPKKDSNKKEPASKQPKQSKKRKTTAKNNEQPKGAPNKGANDPVTILPKQDTGVPPAKKAFRGPLKKRIRLMAEAAAASPAAAANPPAAEPTTTTTTQSATTTLPPTTKLDPSFKDA